MRIGTITHMPDDYSRFARIHDEDGVSYTIDPSVLPEGADESDEYGYRVEIWENDSGLVYHMNDD